MDNVYFTRMFTKISENGTIANLAHSIFSIIGYLIRPIYNPLATIPKSKRFWLNSQQTNVVTKFNLNCHNASSVS